MACYDRSWENPGIDSITGEHTHGDNSGDDSEIAAQMRYLNLKDPLTLPND